MLINRTASEGEGGDIVVFVTHHRHLQQLQEPYNHAQLTVECVREFPLQPTDCQLSTCFQ